MTVRIVTDSVADLPPGVVQELGITVVPLTVSFGTETYRDGVDLTAEEFYHRLDHGGVFPISSAPSPLAYAQVYEKLADETDEILVISLTARLSTSYQAALQGIQLMEKKCRVEVLDSKSAVMAQGFIAITAARAAQAGAGFDEVLDIARHNMPRVNIRGAFDSLEYLKRGGRIGKAQALLGSMLQVHPIITLKNGLVEPAGRPRSRARALDNLFEFAASYSNIEGLAIEYATAAEEAEMLAERLNYKFPKDRIYRSRTSPVIGTHTGPSLIVVSILGDK